MNSETIKLPSVITSQNVIEIHKKSLQSVKKNHPSGVTLDFEVVEHIDSAGVTVLNDIKEKAKEQNVQTDFVNLSPSVQKAFELFGVKKFPKTNGQKKTNFVERVGTSIYEYILLTKDFIFLLADFTYWGFVGLIKPKLRRKGEVIRQSISIGVNALPIVAIIAFLIGFILALQSANQLRQFGANIYVADLVAVAIVGEMGPLITAILVAGRSGSAIAAEIATMKVTEEIDALKSMGVDPLPYLIVPKLSALILTLPMLTILANFIGIFGGAIIGLIYLDLSLVTFFNEVISVLRYKEIATSLVKSLVFAIIIVLTAVHFGLQTKGGPESVGKATTASVVASIFLVIFADTMLSLIFYLE